MSRNCRLYRILPFVIVLMVLPAVAQFEVSPDHFDDQPGTTASSAARQTVSRTVQQQIAAERARLEGYRQRIEEKTAQVEKARQVVASSGGRTDETGSSMVLASLEEGLKRLKSSLAGPIREAEAHITRLQVDRLRTHPAGPVKSELPSASRKN